MSVERLNELKRQADELTAGERLQLADYLNNTTNQPDAKDEFSDAETDRLRKRAIMNWLKEHRSEYAGKYVALDGERLIGFGTTFREASESAREAGVERPFVDYVSPPDGIGWGGW